MRKGHSNSEIRPPSMSVNSRRQRPNMRGGEEVVGVGGSTGPEKQPRLPGARTGWRPKPTAGVGLK